MAQKIIDDVTNLSTPKKMMTAIDENFTELYNDVAVNNNKVGVTDQISSLVEDTSPQLGGDLDLNGHTIQGMTTGGLGAVVEDTSPQLGGDLDLNGHTILNLPASGISEVVEDSTPQLGGTLDTNGNNIDTVTPVELNRVHGVTSPIQSQIDSKIGNLVEDTSPQLGGDLDLNGHTITGLSTGGLGSVAEDTTPQLGGNLDTNGHNIDNVTPTELNHIHGTTSSIQGQIDSKIEKVEDDTAPKLGGSLDLNGHSIIGLPSSNGIMEVADDPTPQLGGDLDLNGHNIIGLPSSNGIMNVVEDVTPQLGGNLDTNGKSIDNVTPTELNHVHGTTSNIQSQIDSKIGNLVEDTNPKLGGDLDLNNHTIIGLTTGGLGAVVEDTSPKLGGTLDTNGNNIDTVTPVELNRVHGVTSPIQSQIDSKISELKDDVSPQLGGDLDLNGHSILSLPVPNHNATGNLNAGDYQHLTAAQKSGLTGGIVTTLHKHDIKEDTTPQLGGDLDTNGHSIDSVTPTELSRVHGVTSPIQTQIDSKISSISEDTTPTLGGNLDLNGNSIGNVTATEFAYIHGITSAIQAQIDAKIASLVEDTNPKLGGDLDLNGHTIPGLSSGGSSGSLTKAFTASDAITAGDFTVINEDGTVSRVSASNFNEMGTETVFSASNTHYLSIAYDSTNQKIVIAYKNAGNSDYGTAIVGTISGDSISFGSPVVFNSNDTQSISAIYDSANQKVVIAYENVGNNYYGTAIVGTVSGDSISFGSPVVFNSARSRFISAIYDSTNQKVVIAYEDYGNNYYGTAIVGTISGDSISFGSPVVFSSVGVLDLTIAYDSANQKVVIGYRDHGNSDYGTAVVGTVSGTSISFGSPVVFNAAYTSAPSAVYDSTNQKIVIAYENVGNNYYGTAIVGTVSGDSISFGSPVAFNSVYTYDIFLTYDALNQKVIVVYRNYTDNNRGDMVVLTVSDDSISFDSPIIFNSKILNYLSIIYDGSNQRAVIVYSDADNNNYGTAITYSVGSSTINPDGSNLIGFSNEDATDANMVEITMLSGVNDTLTGLTPGAAYFIKNDGTLSDSSGVKKVGLALSATDLLTQINI